MARKIKINDLEIEYNVSYRDVKYPRLEMKTGRLWLILPKGYNEDVEEIIRHHKKWIYKKTMEIRNALENAEKLVLFNRSRRELEELIMRYVNEYSMLMNVKYNIVKIRRMKSKWASCSSKGTLTFNELLRFLPDEYIKYIVIHELTHLKIKKHNEQFWRSIEKYHPNYKEIEKQLLSYWFAIMLSKH